MSSNNPRGRQAIDVSAAFTGIAAVLVILRLYTRFFLIRCPGLEDYMITIAMASSIGLTICIALQVHWGMGQHVTEIDPDNTVKTLKAFWASLITYNLVLTTTKISILLQYRRVFTTKWVQIACWANLAFVIGFSLWAMLGSIFACVPVQAFWTEQPGARCINKFAMFFTNAGVNIFQDFLIFLLPIPVVQGLNLNKRQKIALIGIFAVGGFVCIVSILRLHSLVAISGSRDQTYDNAPAATWSSVEANVGIICSCLPLMRPLATRWLPGVFSSNKRSIPTGARPYATIGTSRTKRNTTRNEYALDSRPHSRQSDADIREIVVTTDVRVQVEDDEGNVSGWRTDVSGKEWTEIASSKDTERANSSTDTLVKEP
ncbi:uncharacterized protein CC84DRAFT_1120685, partial [Paraphaeosphaeria sporulosa]